MNLLQKVHEFSFMEWFKKQGACQLEDKPGYHVLPIGDVYMEGCPGKPIEITLYIESVYPGSIYDDTCISELFVFGN